jgi:hypothetical protein
MLLKRSVEKFGFLGPFVIKNWPTSENVQQQIQNNNKKAHFKSAGTLKMRTHLEFLRYILV